MKGYVGRRDFDGVKVYVVTEKTVGGLDRRPLKHLVLHSPDGFEWGYYGSGPADLALAMLADHFGEEPTKAELYQGHFDIKEEEFLEADKTDTHAELMDMKRLQCSRYHQRFKEDFVAKFKKESWKLEGAVIERWLIEQEKGS